MYGSWKVCGRTTTEAVVVGEDHKRQYADITVEECELATTGIWFILGWTENMQGVCKEQQYEIGIYEGCMQDKAKMTDRCAGMQEGGRWMFKY